MVIKKTHFFGQALANNYHKKQQFNLKLFCLAPGSEINKAGIKTYNPGKEVKDFFFLKNAEEVGKAAAIIFYKEAVLAIAKDGVYRAMLIGGKTPKTTYQAIINILKEPKKYQIKKLIPQIKIKKSFLGNYQLQVTDNNGETVPLFSKVEFYWSNSPSYPLINNDPDPTHVINFDLISKLNQLGAGIKSKQLFKMYGKFDDFIENATLEELKWHRLKWDKNRIIELPQSKLKRIDITNFFSDLRRKQRKQDKIDNDHNKSNEKDFLIKLLRNEAIRFEQTIIQDKQIHLIFIGANQYGGILGFPNIEENPSSQISSKLPVIVNTPYLRGEKQYGITVTPYFIKTRVNSVISLFIGNNKHPPLYYLLSDFTPKKTIPIAELREKVFQETKLTIISDESSLTWERKIFTRTDKRDNKTYRLAGDIRKGKDENGDVIIMVHGFMGPVTMDEFFNYPDQNATIVALYRGIIPRNKHKQIKKHSFEIIRHYAENINAAIAYYQKPKRKIRVIGHSMFGTIQMYIAGYLQLRKEYLQIASSSPGKLPFFFKSLEKFKLTEEDLKLNIFKEYEESVKRIVFNQIFTKESIPHAAKWIKNSIPKFWKSFSIRNIFLNDYLINDKRLGYLGAKILNTSVSRLYLEKILTPIIHNFAKNFPHREIFWPTKTNTQIINDKTLNKTIQLFNYILQFLFSDMIKYIKENYSKNLLYPSLSRVWSTISMEELIAELYSAFHMDQEFFEKAYQYFAEELWDNKVKLKNNDLHKKQQELSILIKTTPTNENHKQAIKIVQNEINNILIELKQLYRDKDPLMVLFTADPKDPLVDINELKKIALKMKVDINGPWFKVFHSHAGGLSPHLLHMFRPTKSIVINTVVNFLQHERIPIKTRQLKQMQILKSSS